MQVPNDFQEPSHTLMNDVAVDYERRQLLPAGTAARLQRTAAQTAMPSLLSYQQHLRQSGLCSRLDCWETTYLHVISCPLTERHPIAFFLMGSSLNQFMSQLPPDVQPGFLADYVTGLSAHYPLWKETTAAGQEELFCVFPFNRWFIVATRK
jgi:trans-aconitate methyltransferase